jgi:hypothetical protein
MGEVLNKAILAAMAAASSDVNLMSNDRLEALTSGHGMLNLAVFGIANVIVEEVGRGADIALRFANEKTLQLDDVLAKTIAAAKQAGADSANAALLSALLLYFAGSGVQIGIPVGNRKIGAMARMAAGVDRCGVAAMPTPKWGNKVSGFPAVQAIYQAMTAGQLTEVDGRKLPQGVGAFFIGHSSLGEEIAFPQICRNAGRIGSQAMMNAMAGAAIRPDPLIAAIFGAAATLEIVHPDASTPLPDGTSTNTSYLVGASAAGAVGLPKEFHWEVTGETWDTARMIGDIGLILKDSGGVTIPGMLAFRDCLGVFKEPASAFRPTTPPLGHIAAEPVLTMKALLAWGLEQERVAHALVELADRRVDKEMALVGLNTVARKAEQVRRGPVSNLLIKATDPMRTKALYRRAARAHEEMAEGRSLHDVIHAFDLERKQMVETGSSALLSRLLKKEVTVEIVKVEPLGRKKEKWGRFWVLDMDVDVKVTVDGQTTLVQGVGHEAVPKATIQGDPKLAALLLPACLPVLEISLASHTIINATIPAAVAAVLGKATPREAGKIAEEAAFISGGVPGVKNRAEEVASRAILIALALDET